MSSIDNVFSDENQSRKVLVVDDHHNMRILLVAMIARENVHVDTARNGAEAYGLYKNSQHDPYKLIITDCEMPVMNGIELMRQIKSSGNGVPVVLSSGKTFNSDDEWRREGFADFLPKPYSYKQLLDCIHRYLQE